MLHTQLLRVSLLCSVLRLSAQVSLHDPEADGELARYRARVTVVHDLLLSEKCPEPDTMVKRSTPDESRSEILLAIEKALFEDLIDRLVDCRLINQTTSTQTTTTTPATTTPTTTTPTTTTPTTTTPTTTTPTTTTPSTTTHVPQPLACQWASTLNEAWRHEYSPVDQKPINGSWNCDTREMTRQGSLWFRFSGAAGSRLLNHCIPKLRCGTYATLWSNATMPTDIGVATTIPLYASYGSKCDRQSYTFSVMRCSDKPHDLIYRWSSSSTTCDLGFCGMA